jgi:hypothetical protein
MWKWYEDEMGILRMWIDEYISDCNGECRIEDTDNDERQEKSRGWRVRVDAS